MNVGGGRSRIRTRLHPKFTANRENNREFFEFRLGGRRTRPTSPMFLGLFSRIPYSTEQGIFSTKQGIILHEQGKVVSANREHARLSALALPIGCSAIIRRASA